MHDLHRALADIGSIRLQLAAGTMFRGFGPRVIALTGLLALATGALQAAIPGLAEDTFAYVAVWTATAAVSSLLIGLEMIARTRRHHAGLADSMLFNAVEHFLPVGVAGAVIAAILLRFAPDTAWLLPGLWQMLVGVGLFVALRFLPRSVSIAAGWYLVAGAAVLMLACQSRSLSPWAMAIPFGIGQCLLAILLHMALGDDHGED